MSTTADWGKVYVDIPDRSYEIVIGTDCLARFATTLAAWMREGAELDRRAVLIVTDRHLVENHAAVVGESLQQFGWTVDTVALEPGEPSKSLETAAFLYDRLIALGADRCSIVVAVGGGVVGDVAGFAAATYSRGIGFVQAPTTLLADVDSSVGGKVGVNHPQAKNMIGAFHQPLGVFIDTAALDTLPDRDYRSGLAEVVKYGAILDAAFFEWLESHAEAINARQPEALRKIIARSCRLKADVVENDEFERTGLRSVLNYGHTFAHAFEALAGYGELLHGEAVAIGMVCASRLAERRGLIDASVTRRQLQLLSALGCPTELPNEFQPTPEAIVERMRLDKKAVAGRLRFVLPTRLGHVELFGDVDEADVRAVLRGA